MNKKVKNEVTKNARKQTQNFINNEELKKNFKFARKMYVLI